MSYSQPPRRPQGARQRTQDGKDRQSSVHQSDSEASYRVTEDGFISSDYPNEGSTLSRSRRPPRSDTGGSSMSTRDPLQYVPTQGHIVDSPSENPTLNRSNNDLSRRGPRTQRSLGADAPHLFSSPAQSMTSLRRESETDDPRRGYPSSSSRLPSLQSGTGNFTSSSSSQDLYTTTPSSIESRNDRVAVRQQSSAHESTASTASDDATSTRSHTLSKWSTIRRAVHQTPPPPPVPQLPSSHQPGLRVTPAVSSVSGSTIYGSAAGFAIPRPGSAMSSLSDAALAPPPSTISSTSSATNSRSAKAMRDLRNVVDHARTNVGMGMGMGMGMGGLTSLGGFGRGAAPSSAAIQRLVTEDDSPFARDLLQACSISRFGLPPGARGPTGIQTIGSAAAAGLRRPMRKATTDGGSNSASGASTPGNDPPQNPERSLKPVYHLIINQASLLSSQNQRSSYFPYHSVLLSTLLSVFLVTGLDEREKRMAETEQWMAVEVYEVFTKAWPIFKRPQDEVDRWLWCCHAAAQESTSTAVRSRLLLALDLAFSAVRPAKSPSPLSSYRNLDLLVNSLFLIYPHVFGPGSESALNTLNSIVSKLRSTDGSGVVGELELAEIEINFGARGTSGETGDDFRSVILTGSAINLLAMGSDSSRKWYLLNFLEVFLQPPHYIVANTSLSIIG